MSILSTLLNPVAYVVPKKHVHKVIDGIEVKPPRNKSASLPVRVYVLPLPAPAERISILSTDGGGLEAKKTKISAKSLFGFRILGYARQILF